MKKVYVKRTWKLIDSVATPVYAIAGIDKEEFLSHFSTDGSEWAKILKLDRGIEWSALMQYGKEIKNGRRVKVKVENNVTSLFLATYYGDCTDVINIDDYITAGKDITFSFTVKHGLAIK